MSDAIRQSQRFQLVNNTYKYNNNKMKLIMKNKKRIKILEDQVRELMACSGNFSKTESELTELPEKWCVKYDFCHLNIIVKFLNWKTKVQTESGYLYSYINIHALINEKPSGYTEITFDQFKKWVLKEDEKKGALDQARKYTNNTIEEAIKNIEKLSIREVQVKVSSQEEANECAEIAKACGYNVSHIEPARTGKEYLQYKSSLSFKGFGFYEFDNNKTEISLQEYREFFGLWVVLYDEDIKKLAHKNFPYGSKCSIGSRDRSLYENKKEYFINGFNAGLNYR